MKNKKYLEEDKPVSKPGKKKSKDWMIEYRWKSLQEYNKYPKRWYRSDTYSEEWRPVKYSNKFHTSKAAIQSIDQFMKVSQSYHKNNLLTGFYDDNFGKDFRVRNLKTGEIYEYDSNRTDN
jgi:hypothetical protein